MNTACRLFALFFLAAGAGSQAWSGGGEIAWLIDNEEAQEVARSEGRPIFMIFVGSDWCVWCERMEDEILSTVQFADYAGEHLILLKIDFPKSIELPEARMKKNRKLQNIYRISGYPTVVITDSEGAVLGRLPYMTGGPEPFLGELSKLIE
jgi:thioredoxin-related protein